MSVGTVTKPGKEADITGYDRLHSKIQSRSITVGIVGLGYVGLPLSISIADAGMVTVGFDTDPKKLEKLRAGQSYIDGIEADEIIRLVKEKRLIPEANMDRLGECDIVVVCVPTPLTRFREPDLSYVRSTTELIAQSLRDGQLIILTSTTWPGTTVEVMKPILERTGLRCEDQFWLGYSPEREDPGREGHNTTAIPRIVSGCGPQSSELVSCFYRQFIESVIPVTSTEVAEAAKITENVFRAVNIALVNELKSIYSGMDIDVWEVIDAASSKPFGFMPFYPGPGLGGHCVPIDPFYLTWKAKETDHRTRFIELAGEINLSMPKYVINILKDALDQRAGKTLSASKILLIGLAYKKNVSDIRESPALKILEILTEGRCDVMYHDPYRPEIPQTRNYRSLRGIKSVEISAENLKLFDAIIVVTDHDNVDYGLIACSGKIVIDTRNVMRRKGIECRNLVLA